MADLNTVIISGRLTRDAELKYTNSGLAITSFAVAVNTRKKSGDEWVDEGNFFDVSAFGKVAENLNEWLKKGKEVGIEGMLKQDRWEQDGQSRSKVYIIASNIKLMGAVKTESSEPKKKEHENAPSNPSTSNSHKPSNYDDDIPF